MEKPSNADRQFLNRKKVCNIYTVSLSMWFGKVLRELNVFGTEHILNQTDWSHVTRERVMKKSIVYIG